MKCCIRTCPITPMVQLMRLRASRSPAAAPHDLLSITVPGSLINPPPSCLTSSILPHSRPWRCSMACPPWCLLMTIPPPSCSPSPSP